MIRHRISVIRDRIIDCRLCATRARSGCARLL